jgi:sugar lactone lactonase YvrE
MPFFVLFIFFFLLNIAVGFGQNPEAIPPEYEWIDEVDMGTAGISNPEAIIIAIATDSDGFIYTLSFGNGVDKLNPDGSINQSQFIPAGQLQSPLDIAIDGEGTIYIADYFESKPCTDNGKVKVFSSNGSLQNEIAYSYFRPLGLTVDSDDNIYVAEYYDDSTCETGEESRIRVFDKNGGFLNETENVEIPYRLAVNSNDELYVSQAGDNNPQVLMYHSGGNSLAFRRRL